MTSVTELEQKSLEQEPQPGRYALGLPGQGGTTIGAGYSDFLKHPASAEVFEHSDIVVGRELDGFSVTRLVFGGPQEELEKTLNNHIGNTTIYLAKYAGFREQYPYSPSPEVIMPVSMGECAALAISGVVGPEEALQIAIKRGQATERVGKENPGCMASILDLKGGLPQLEELLGEVRADMGGIVDVSNVYTDKDLVISGQIPQVEEALRRLEGVRKAYKLPISFASHCGLMDEASEEFGQEIAEFEFADPQMPWIMNGELVLKGPEIKRRMVEGLKKRINVKDSFALIKERGIPVMYEMSPKAEEKSIFERYAKSVTPELVIKPR